MLPASSSHAKIIASSEEEKQFSLPDAGATILLQPHSESLLSEDKPFRLMHGGIFIRATGVLPIDAGLGIEVSLFAGSAVIVRDAATTTIVALSTPLIVTRLDQEWILPPGSQMLFDSKGLQKRSRAPFDWLSDSIAQCESLPISPVPSLTQAEQEALALLLISDHDSVLLQRFTDAEKIHLLQQSVDLSGFDISLQSVQTAFAIADSFPTPVLSHLLALRLAMESSHLDRSSADLLVSVLASDRTLSSELVFAIPTLALSTLQPLPSSLIDLWAERVLREAVVDGSATASLLHDVIPTLPQRFEDAGYPKQAILWRGAIRKINIVLSTLLSGVARVQFSADVTHALQETALSSSASSASVVAPNVSTETPTLNPENLLAMTRDLLQAHGVLFTTATQIRISDIFPDCALVSGVFLRKDDRDIPYTFTMCPVSGFVRRITENGTALPNDVPFDLFFH